MDFYKLLLFHSCCEYSNNKQVCVHPDIKPFWHICRGGAAIVLFLAFIQTDFQSGRTGLHSVWGFAFLHIYSRFLFDLFMVLFNSNVSLFSFCLDNLSIEKNDIGVLMSPIITMLGSICDFSSSKLCFEKMSYICLELKYLLGGLFP